MAKEKNQKQHFNMQEAGGKAEAFYLQYARIINIIGIIIIVIICGYFGYKYLYIAPKEKKAQAAIYKAQEYFAKDSFNLALNGDGNNYGYLQVINKYSGTQVADLAKYSAGICYVHLGQYQKGIDKLKGFKPDDKIIQATAYGIIGDAYMELGKTAEGVDYYKKAGNYNDNKVFSPLYLMRAGLALEKEGKPKDALVLYQQIKKKYPNSQEGREIDKYLAQLGDVE